MQIGNIRLHIGHGDVEVKDVTPAEVAILTHDDPKIGHKSRAGKFPASGLKIIGEAKAREFDHMDNVWKDTDKPRTDRNEYERLWKKFGKQKVEKVYPASASKLPEKFADVQGWEDAQDIELLMPAPAPTKVEEKKSATTTEPPKK